MKEHVGLIIATTRYKLQGVSKGTLIVNDLKYRHANCIYVALSRVRAREGLFLVRPLDLDKGISILSTLVDFERRMKHEK